MTRRLRIDDLTAIAVPSQPALSPDGARIVYTLRTPDAGRDRNVEQLWTVPVAGGTPRRLTTGDADTDPAWAPDGRRLAFLREGQLHLLPADGGDPERVTDLPLGAGAPVWSPDGDRLAFTAPVDPTDGTGPLVATRVDFQADGAGMYGAVRHQLHVLDLASGACRQVTDGREHAGRPAWSPDGRTLAFTRKVGEDSDLTWRTAVHLLDVADPKAGPRVVALEGGVAGAVWYAADGASLLVVGHPGDPVGHQHLFRVPLGGGEPTSLTGHLDRNVMAGAPAYPGGRPHETADGRVLFCIRDRGCTHLWSTGATEGPVLAGEGRVVSGLSVAGDTAVVVLGTPTSYGELVALDLATGEETVLTDHGAGLRDVELFVPESRTFTISDGTEVQAWLVRDPDRSGPRPLLLDVHGGPHNAWNAAADEMHLYHQELAARGWVVLLVNPRGSDGYGESFFDGVNGAWGVADAHDFLEPIDALVAEGVADADRLAVTGYSYGGFMTCWLTGHDDRFAAGVAGGVVSDMTSMYGTSDDGPCMSRLRAGRHAVGAAGDLRRDVAADPGRRRDHADADPPRPRRPDLPGRPGAAVAHLAARAWRPDRAGALPGRLPRVHPARPAVAARRLPPPGRRLGGAVHRCAVAVRAWTARTGSGGWRCSPRSTTCPAPSSASSHGDDTVERGVRRPQQAHRPAGHHRRGLPDRLDQQGVDGHGRHAAGRRGKARPRRAGGRGASRAPALGPGRHQAA